MTRIHGTDPRTGETVSPGVSESNPHDVERVLAAAHAAAQDFTQSPPETRIALLRALAERLEAQREGLVELAARESGLTNERLAGEVLRTSGQLRLFADVIAEGSYLEAIIDHADDTTAPPRPDLRRYLRPLGPVLVYAASNFPFAFSVLGGDTASALAGGAPVVVKAHPSHPNLSAAVAALAIDTAADLSLPTGLFALVVGDDAGVQALRDTRVKACGFTGSTTAGRYLFDIAANRPDPIPFYGELGSINPVIVTAAAAHARAAAIADGFVNSYTMGAGQFCTKPGLLFVPAESDLEQHVANALADASAAPMLNHRIHSQLQTGLQRLAAHPGITELSPVDEEAPGEGCWATPRLFTTTAAALAAEPAQLIAEYFGPTALIVKYADGGELTDALDVIPGSLTATLHAEPDDPSASPGLLRKLEARAGRLIWNGWPTGVAVTWSMHHGGPWPATTSIHTSVGATAIRRWLSPICYQDAPAAALPPPLREENPWRISRRIDGRLKAVPTALGN